MVLRAGWFSKKRGTALGFLTMGVSFEAGGETIGGYSLIIDTELIRYKWVSVNGDFPDYEKLIPTEFNTFAHLDTVEAIKAVNSLKALSNGKDYPIDLTIG